MLEIKNLTVQHGQLTVLQGVTLHLEAGQWLMVAGPNGAGKSTLVQAIAQGVAYRGEIHLRGQNMRHLKPAAIAREIGVLTQRYAVNYAFTVEEVVNLGRYAHRKDRLDFSDEQGTQAVGEALEITGLSPLRQQSVLTLSGGELQRTFLAQVFAQCPNLIVLDEPTNHLDLAYQKQVFELIQAWVQKPGRAVLSVVHDISLALAYGTHATHALLLHQGQQVAYGENRAVLSPENLQRVYGMDVHGWMREMLGQWG